MSSGYARRSDVRAEGRAADPRTGEEQVAGKAAARERREAYVRGHQLAEMRAAAGLTQAELAHSLGVSQARVSKIEHGEISGINVVRAYVSALGGPSTWSPGSATGAGRWPDRLPARRCRAVQASGRQRIRRAGPTPRSAQPRRSASGSPATVRPGRVTRPSPASPARSRSATGPACGILLRSGASGNLTGLGGCWSAAGTLQGHRETDDLNACRPVDDFCDPRCVGLSFFAPLITGGHSASSSPPTAAIGFLLLQTQFWNELHF